jgi:putative peptide zinc metalloprotease protein
MRALRRAVIVLALFAGCSSGGDRTVTGPTSASTSAPERLTLAIVRQVPHDPAAFTEGLVFAGDRLYESSGGYGTSDVREVDPTTGTVLRSVPLPADEFGEGLGEHGGSLVQLTWRERIARRWSLDLAPGSTSSYSGEGWGLSWDPTGRRWVQSDGSSRLTFRAPDSFAVLGRQEVRREGRPVRRLNELEVVGRDVWANVWQSDDLLRIDLATGRVTAVVDASALGPHPRPDSDAVLNGIAHRAGDAASRLWVTGKRWPSMYVVEVR